MTQAADNAKTAATKIKDMEPVIKAKEMEPELQAYVMAAVQYSMKNHSSWQDMATYLNQQLNLKSTGHWHVFVGRNFGSFVTYQAKHYIYFYIGQIAFLLFKTFKN